MSQGEIPSNAIGSNCDGNDTSCNDPTDNNNNRNLTQARLCCPEGRPSAIFSAAAQSPSTNQVGVPHPFQPFHAPSGHTPAQSTACVQNLAPGANENPHRVNLTPEAKEALRDAVLSAILHPHGEVDPVFLQCALSRGLPKEVVLHAAAAARQRDRRNWETKRAAQDPFPGADHSFTAAAIHSGQQGALYGYTTGQRDAALQAQRHTQQQVEVQAALLGTMLGYNQDSVDAVAASAAAREILVNDLLLQTQLTRSIQQQQEEEQVQQQQQIQAQQHTAMSPMKGATANVVQATAGDLFDLQRAQDWYTEKYTQKQKHAQQQASVPTVESACISVCATAENLHKTRHEQGQLKRLSRMAETHCQESAILTNHTAATSRTCGGTEVRDTQGPDAPCLWHSHVGTAMCPVLSVPRFLPCPARRMPPDHTFTSAYFVVDESTKHGTELVCTYPECRWGGVKFRYCRHCGVPVATRNFRTQHMHGVLGGEGDKEEDGDSKCNSEDREDGGQGDHEGATTSLPFKKRQKMDNVCIPCHARGMPLEHNSNTAYFVISPDTAHGDELLCSFPSCNSAGAKFRYCLYCKKPVARGNFKNRHMHCSANTNEKNEKASKGPALKDDDRMDRANVATSELPDYLDHKVHAEGQKAGVSLKMPGVLCVKAEGGGATEGGIDAKTTAESQPPPKEDSTVKESPSSKSSTSVPP